MERHYQRLTANRAQGTDSRQIRFAPPRDPSRRRAARGQRLEVLEYSAAASLASATLDRPPQWPRRIEHAASPKIATWRHGPNWRRGCGPGGASGCRVATSRPSLGRQHSCAQAAPPLEPQPQRLSGSGHVIPRWSLPRSRRSAIAIQDEPRSKMPSLACWLPLSLLASDRYGGTKHLFPVRRETVGPGVLELHGTPLVVAVLDLRDHQADTVRLRATPEPERPHEPRQQR